MGRPKFRRDFGIILRSRVLVADEDRDRCAECLALKHAGQNLAAIFFFALARDLALPGPTAIKLALYVCFAEVNHGRATIDDDADAAAMRFAKGGYTKKLTKGIAHRGRKFKRNKRDL